MSKLGLFFISIALLVAAFDLGQRTERAHCPKVIPVPTSATTSTFDGKGNITSQRLFVCTQAGTAEATQLAG